jgi:hypothetical protein
VVDRRPKTTGLLSIGNSARIGAQDGRYSTILLRDYRDFRSISKIIIARPFLSFKDVFRDVFVCADILRLSLENSLLVL